MLQSIMLVVHVAACVLIIALVLLQRGKGAEAGTGFGAGASGTVFGARGSASFLSRATAALVAMFYVTSLALAFFANQRTAPSSLLESAPPAAIEQPQSPAPELPNVELPSGEPSAGSDELPDVPSVQPAPESDGGKAPDAGQQRNDVGEGNN